MTKTLFAGALAAIFLSGCATILSGRTQLVTFRSVPESAAISITNRAGEKVHAGTTPTTLTLKRGAGYFRPEHYTVKVEKDGYEPKEFTVAGRVNGWYFGNVLFGGMLGMIIVDPATGAMFSLAPDKVETALAQVGAQTSNGQQTLTVVLAKDLPHELWQHAQLLR